MLDKMCPYYMAMGVSYDEFWNGDYTKLKYYERAHQLKIEQRNQELWLQGLYNHEAVGVALANAFRKKGSPPEKYPEKPHRITPMDEDEKKAEAQKQAEQFRRQLEAFAKKCEVRHRREREENAAREAKTNGNSSRQSTNKRKTDRAE